MTAVLPDIDETIKLAKHILTYQANVNGFVNNTSKSHLQIGMVEASSQDKHLTFGQTSGFYDDLNMYPFYYVKKEELKEFYYRLVSDLIKICHVNYKLKQNYEDLFKKVNKTEFDHTSSLEKNAKTENELSKMADRLKAMQESINNLKCEKESQKDSFNIEISNLQQKLNTQLKEIQSSHDKAISEKNDMVLKYARSEKEVLDLKNKYNRLNDLNKQEVRLRENLSTKLKNALTDLNKTTSSLEERSKEVCTLKRELVREKEEAHNLATTLKWTQNKLSSESENHKGTKRYLENTMAKFAELKTEISAISKESNNQPPLPYCDNLPPPNLISSEPTALERPTQDNPESQTLVNATEYMVTKKSDIIAQVELDLLRRKHGIVLQEMESTKAKVMMLESDCQKRTLEIHKLKSSLDQYQTKCAGLEEQLSDANQRLAECQRLRQELAGLREKLSCTEETNRDVSLELKAAQEREKKALEFTEGVSMENAKIAGEIGYLREKAETLTVENEKAAEDGLRLKNELSNTIQELKNVKRRYDSEKCENGKLNAANNALSSQLGQLIEDHRNEIKLLKKKYLVCSKDLANHLKSCQQAQSSSSRTQAELPYATPVPSLSNEDREDAVSRISSFSISSLTNNVENLLVSPVVNTSDDREQFQAQGNEEGGFEMVEDPNSSSIRLMVEKTLRLQKALARKRDKIEFLNDHVVRLQEEVQKKAKIIQTLLLHEQSGALTTDEIDENKVLMAQKSGIMASIYNPLKVDRQMTLELSMDINKKLQNLLEDSLLKIIVLKEGMENLGLEISRLLQENKVLKQKVVQQVP